MQSLQPLGKFCHFLEKIAILTRILPLGVMIVKLRQNFKKRRKFSWIRGQKKKLCKKYLSFTRYDYVPKHTRSQGGGPGGPAPPIKIPLTT